MDQKIGAVAPIIEIYPQDFGTVTGNLPENRGGAEKYLPETEQQLKNEFGRKRTASRCVSLISAKKTRDHYTQLAKNIVATVDPDFFDSIDEESWGNMADSLKFSRVDSLEKAIAMDLRVCPPCPVFHTWAALHGTTIFNGSNNPKRYAGIDYVQRILEEGSKLGENGIPLLIVFSDMDLTSDQIGDMKDEFSQHDNILCVSLETDLQLGFIKELEKYASAMTLEFMDSIRIVVSQNISKVKSFCIAKAKSEGKINLAARLENLDSDYLFYSDIDNQWLSKPPFILARHGIFTQPELSTTLSLVKIIEDKIEKLSDSDRQRLDVHRSYFSQLPYFNKGKSGCWSTDKAKKLFSYIFSGEAESNFHYLSRQIANISPYSEFLTTRDNPVSWYGENSCFFVAEHSKDIFLKGALKRPCIIDLHQKPISKIRDDIYNPDPYYREAHSLIGMQLLRYYYQGHDYTWNQWEEDA